MRIENLLHGFSRREFVENQFNGDPGARNHGLTHHDSRRGGNRVVREPRFDFRYRIHGPFPLRMLMKEVQHSVSGTARD